MQNYNNETLIQTALTELPWAKYVYNSAYDWYDFNSKSKRYHNSLHVANVINSICDITHTPSLALILAARWHDAVYVPGAGSDANERCSAAALNSTYQQVRDKIEDKSYADSVIQEAMRLVINTAVSVHLHSARIESGVTAAKGDTDLAILLDADLSSLAADYNLFLKNQVNIITENFGTISEHTKNSVAFLSKFLTCREFIYHTAEGRFLWEDKARNNIMQYAAENAIEVNV